CALMTGVIASCAMALSWRWPLSRPGTSDHPYESRFELGAALREHHPACRLYGEAGIAPSGLQGRDYFEADIAFTCAPADHDARGIVGEPLLIIEILSPSTERDDIFVKLPVHQRIASTREILYVETSRVGATLCRRDGDGWRATAIEGSKARL